MERRTQTCIEPDYGSINHDGYVRVLNKPRKKGGRLVMFHRKVWEESNGPIPDGHEINHICKNRKCINLEHLECLTVSEHKSKDNALRYRERIEAVLKYKLENPYKTQKEIGKPFGMTQSGVSQLLKREIQIVD